MRWQLIVVAVWFAVNAVFSLFAALTATDEDRDTRTASAVAMIISGTLLGVLLWGAS